MDLNTYGFDKVEFVPRGGEDRDVFTAADVVAGGTLSRPELILRLVFSGPLASEGVITHNCGEKLLSKVEVEAGATEWVGELLMGRGTNDLSFQGFGEENLELCIFHRTTLAEIIDGLVKALILLVLVQTFVVQTYRIPSSSMENTFKPGDYVLVEKLTFMAQKPKIGDIIVFRFPLDFRKEFVKRVIAKAGSEVILKEKRLVIDGDYVEEPFASYREWLPFSGDSRHRDVGPVVIPEEHIFVMGDNRDNSLDSREWGPLALHYISGRPWMIYWPPGRMGLVRHGCGK